MINAKELRVGNYVNPCHNNNSLGVIVPITGIIARIFTIEFFKCKLANEIELSFAEQECYDYELNMIEPISITKEWLLKLGFKFDEITEYFTEENVYVKYYNDFGIKIEENGIFYNGIYQQKLKYIHQLQNLYFALTGEELTI